MTQKDRPDDPNETLRTCHECETETSENRLDTDRIEDSGGGTRVKIQCPECGHTIENRLVEEPDHPPASKSEEASDHPDEAMVGISTTELLPRGIDPLESELTDEAVNTARELAATVLETGDLMEDIDRAVDNRDLPVGGDTVDEDFDRAVTSAVDSVAIDRLNHDTDNREKIVKHATFLLSDYLTE